MLSTVLLALLFLALAPVAFTLLAYGLAYIAHNWKPALLLVTMLALSWYVSLRRW